MRAPKTRAENIQELDSIRSNNGAVEDDYELSEEEILDSIERGLRQMLAGQGRPVQEFLDELDNE